MKIRLTVLVNIFFFTTFVFAEIYKCDIDDKTIFSDKQCASDAEVITIKSIVNDREVVSEKPILNNPLLIPDKPKINVKPSKKGGGAMANPLSEN